MARSRSSSSSTTWRYINPAYYLKRPKRLALLFIAFVSVSFFVWERQTLVREHEEELWKLKEELLQLQNQLEELKPDDFPVHKTNLTTINIDDLPVDPIEIQRRENE